MNSPITIQNLESKSLSRRSLWNFGFIFIFYYIGWKSNLVAKSFEIEIFYSQLHQRLCGVGDLWSTIRIKSIETARITKHSNNNRNDTTRHSQSNFYFGSAKSFSLLSHSSRFSSKSNYAMTTNIRRNYLSRNCFNGFLTAEKKTWCNAKRLSMLDGREWESEKRVAIHHLRAIKTQSFVRHSIHSASRVESNIVAWLLSSSHAHASWDHSENTKLHKLVCG